MRLLFTSSLTELTGDLVIKITSYICATVMAQTIVYISALTTIYEVDT